MRALVSASARSTMKERRLLARIQQLEERIEVVYGELYTKRLELPLGIADP